FKKWHGIAKIKLHKEDASADVDAATAAILKLNRLLEQYHLQDIYNMDETTLFYQLEPDTTLATMCLSRRKKNKERLTIVLYANASGTDRFETLVIGKYKNPQYFKNVNRRSFGIKYEANIKAWMTVCIFQWWLKPFDWRMEGHKVILLLDSSKTHSTA
ncbi:16359_t:CDS:2, partial [Cetraspora pellucida]